MSEYWKSLPRKFCDTCKCWFADNKASIEFHEKGKRHQENVQKRINDIQKRGIKEYKKMKELENQMDKIEKAALAAYKKDLQNNVEVGSTHSDTSEPITSFTSEPITEVTSEPAPTVKKNYNVEIPKSLKKHKEMKVKYARNETKFSKKKSGLFAPKETSKKWYEGVTDEGHKYYWNIENSESCWEVPEEGYVSIEEQAVQSQEIPSTDVKDNVEMGAASTADGSETNDDVDSEQMNNASSSAYGPQPKVNPYGQWVTVEEKVEEPIDLQLPKQKENIIEYISIHPEERHLKFKEKVIGQLPNSNPNEEVLFKKRKFNGSSKRNVRQRNTDD